MQSQATIGPHANLNGVLLAGQQWSAFNCLLRSSRNVFALMFQEGQTALHIACMEGHMIIVEELLSRGASCHIYTKVIIYTLR